MTLPIRRTGLSTYGNHGISSYLYVLLDACDAIRRSVARNQKTPRYADWRIGIVSTSDEWRRAVKNHRHHQVLRLPKVTADSIAEHYAEMGMARLDTVPLAQLPGIVYLYVYLAQ